MEGFGEVVPVLGNFQSALPLSWMEYITSFSNILRGCGTDTRDMFQELRSS